MRVALFADIHANLEALGACLEHARARGADRLAFLGDLVGYGADAAGVIDVITAHAASGALVLKGNHDEAVEVRSGYYNDAAQAALDWARQTLSSQQRAFLAALPLVHRIGSACYVHASAARPERWEYVDSPAAAARCVTEAETTHTFCGHVHDQVLYFEAAGGRMSAFRPVPGKPIPVRGRRRWLAIVGSVGQPRDRNPAAAYTLFDDEAAQVTFHRVPYDARGAADKIRRAGLPESLAFRVELGI
jgi:diadenosine tetraphosphatase ApaH/serine/threonine PP2A family protein phosphatase